MSWTDVTLPLAFLSALGGMALLLGKGGQKTDKARGSGYSLGLYAYT